MVHVAPTIGLGHAIQYHANMTRTLDPVFDPFGGRNSNVDLGGPLPIAQLYVPSTIRLEGERLVWTTAKGTVKNPGKSLLPEFVALAEAEPDAVLKFAQRWGVLRLCDQHELPVTHAVRAFHVRGGDPAISRCRTPRSSHGFYEPIDAWRVFARQARAIVRTAGHQARGRAALPEDLALLWDAQARPVLRIRGEQRVLVDAVNVWLGVANVGVFLTSREGGRKLVFSGGLFGAIGMRLAAAITGSPDFAICCQCGATYTPGRTPASTKPNYCIPCGSKIPQQNASCRWRKKDKLARLADPKR